MLSVLRLKYIRKPVTSHPHHYHPIPAGAFFSCWLWSSLLLSPPGPPSLLVLQRNSFKTFKSAYVSLLKTFRRLLNSLRVKVRFSLGLQGPASRPHALSDAASSTSPPSLTVPLATLRMLLPQNPCTCLSLCLEHGSVEILGFPPPLLQALPRCHLLREPFLEPQIYTFSPLRHPFSALFSVLALTTS